MRLVLLTLLFKTVSAKSGYCEACTELLSLVENKTCDELPALCDSLPAGVAVTICDFLFEDTHVCDDVLQWLENGASPQEACEDIGLCSGGNCKCGVCTPAIAALNTTKDYRCLALPNSCGHNTTSTARGSPEFLAAMALVKPHDHSGFCVDGECGPDKSVGCCLTCL